MLTTVADPGVPEPGLTVSVPPPLELVDAVEVSVELSAELVVEVSGVVGVVGGVGRVGVDGLVGWFHGNGNGAENVVMPKKPMMKKAVVEKPKGRMAGNGLEYELYC